MVEKPAADVAPSRLAIIGRYILQPEVMDVLGSQEEGAGGEIQLTDALARMIGQQPFHGVTFAGTRYDCGDKSGFVTATLALRLARPDVAPAVRSDENTSERQSLMRRTYAVFCLKKKKQKPQLKE